MSVLRYAVVSVLMCGFVHASTVFAQKTTQETTQKTSVQTTQPTQEPTKEPVKEYNPEYARGLKHYTKKEYAQAAEWFTKAAEQGLSGAQFNLGSMYAHGEGTLKDHAQARKWFKKAADNGFPGAKEELQKLDH